MTKIELDSTKSPWDECKVCGSTMLTPLDQCECCKTRFWVCDKGHINPEVGHDKAMRIQEIIRKVDI